MIRERILQILRERGMSQAQLAARIGMKPQQLSAIMTGKHAPTLESLRRIAFGLDVSVITLIEERESEVANA